MTLYMKQQVFTWGDKFDIYDSNGNVVYFARGEVFSFGKKLHLYGRGETEAAYIEQKLFSFRPKYYVYINNRQVAEVVRQFAMFHHCYTVNGPDWTVEGEFMSHEFHILSCGRNIVNVSKEWFTWGDSYAINIADDSDELLALAVALVVDACIAADSNN